MSKLIYSKFYLPLTFISLFLIAAPVFALSSGGVGGYPAHPDPSIKYSESWFIYNLDLGESKDDALTIFNTTDEVQTVKVYAVDSVPSNQGNFALEAEADPKDGIGAWIKLSQDLITLQPGENQEILFTITIPQNADVGEHSGGIILQKVQGSQDQLQNGASIVTRVGIRVYETVPGEIKKVIEIKDFNVNLKKLKDQDPYYEINLTAENQGNVSLQPKVTLAIGGWGKIDYDDIIDISVKKITKFVTGQGEAPIKFFTGEELSRNWQLLRDQKVSTNWTWPKPRFGRFTFQANLTYDTADGATTINSRKITVWVIPWVELAVLGVIILLTIALFITKKIWYSGRGWISYKILPNDRLLNLAKKANINWKILAKVNKLKKPYSLEPGQKILVPPTLFKGKSDMVKQKALVRGKSK